MKIAIASDHGGYQLKELLKEYIKGMEEYEILDLGRIGGLSCLWNCCW